MVSAASLHKAAFYRQQRGHESGRNYGFDGTGTLCHM